MANESRENPIRVVNLDYYLAERSDRYSAERKASESLGGELVLEAARTEEEIIRTCTGARIVLTEGLFVQ